MNVLIDTNVVLDVLGNREPFVQHSEAVLTLAAQNRIAAAITANTVTDIYYLLRKHLSDNEAVKTALMGLLELLDVIEVTKADCLKAFDLPMGDYEDALLACCAKRRDAEYIVTRNPKDFVNSPVEAITPGDFLRNVAAMKDAP
jgi:predicted nucleic acid-binding protein